MSGNSEWEADQWVGLRRQPIQARSRRRLTEILAAAERMLVRDRVHAFSMRGLAEEAKVPIGSVYQYFEDRRAVFEVIVAQHGGGLQAILDEATTPDHPMGWQDAVAHLIDRQCERLRAHPAYVAIWIGRELSPQAQQQDDQDIELMAEALCHLLVTQERLTTNPQLQLSCLVATQAADGLVQLAFRQDPTGHEPTIAEAKALVRLYLTSLAEKTRQSSS